MPTVFLRLLAEDDKEAGLSQAIADLAAGRESGLYHAVEPGSFAQVPGSPFAYWISERSRRVFNELSAFETKGRAAKVGLQTSDDLRFVCAGWGVPTGMFRERWFPFAKGGVFCRHYDDVHLLVNWYHIGVEMKSFAETTPGTTHWSRNLRNIESYFRPGLTWPRRTQSGLALRVMPAGCVFADKGPAAFVDGDDHRELLSLCYRGTQSVSDHSFICRWPSDRSK